MCDFKKYFWEYLFVLKIIVGIGTIIITHIVRKYWTCNVMAIEV